MCTRQRSSQATPCLKRHDRAQTSQHHNYMAPTIPTMMVTLHEASFRTPGSRFSKRHPCVVPSTKAMQKTSKNSCNSRHKDVTQTSLKSIENTVLHQPTLYPINSPAKPQREKHRRANDLNIPIPLYVQTMFLHLEAAFRTQRFVLLAAIVSCNAFSMNCVDKVLCVVQNMFCTQPKMKPRSVSYLTCVPV